MIEVEEEPADEVIRGGVLKEDPVASVLAVDDRFREAHPGEKHGSV